MLEKKLVLDCSKTSRQHRVKSTVPVAFYGKYQSGSTVPGSKHKAH